jgi:hypothetical protein
VSDLSIFQNALKFHETILFELVRQAVSSTIPIIDGARGGARAVRHAYLKREKPRELTHV